MTDECARFRREYTWRDRLRWKIMGWKAEWFRFRRRFWRRKPKRKETPRYRIRLQGRYWIVCDGCLPHKNERLHAFDARYGKDGALKACALLEVSEGKHNRDAHRAAVCRKRPRRLRRGEEAPEAGMRDSRIYGTSTYDKFLATIAAEEKADNPDTQAR